MAKKNKSKKKSSKSKLIPSNDLERRNASIVHGHLERGLSMCEERRDEFIRFPEKDFTRDRDISMKDTILNNMCIKDDNLKDSIRIFFNYVKSPEPSALTQQNNKIKLHYYEFLYKFFTSKLKNNLRFYGYKLLACDGTSINIRTNKKETEICFIPTI